MRAACVTGLLDFAAMGGLFMYTYISLSYAPDAVLSVHAESFRFGSLRAARFMDAR